MTASPFYFILAVISMLMSWPLASLMATLSQIKGKDPKRDFRVSVGVYALIIVLLYSTLIPLEADLAALGVFGLLISIGLFSLPLNFLVRQRVKPAIPTSRPEVSPAKDPSRPIQEKQQAPREGDPHNERKPAKTLAMLENLKLVRKKANQRQIFISYRRTDSADIAGRIYDRLVAKFGKGPVFKDVDSIPLGLDFKEYLDQKVGECDVLLAIIGDHWMDARDGAGRQRLDDPTDFVRIEIESALERGIPVIPLLVRGAQMPEEQNLPIGLRKLVYRNGLPIRSDPDFHRDMDRLINALEK